MLALTRKIGQSIIVGDFIEVTVVEVKGDQVRLGIKAPREVSIFRKELYEEIQKENKAAASVNQGAMDGLDILLAGAIKEKTNKDR